MDIEDILSFYEDEIYHYTQMPTSDVDWLISPSKWNRRMNPEFVCQYHEKLLAIVRDEFPETIKVEKDIKYGDTEKQAYDIIHQQPITEKSPIFIFFHGGFWQALSRQHCYGYGSTIAENGGVFVTMGYDLAPDVALRDIVIQAIKGLEHVIQRFEKNKNIYVGGFSAGAFLALLSLTLSQKWDNFKNSIKGLILFSGIYDLRPAFYSNENKNLKITSEEAKSWSLLHKDVFPKLLERIKEGGGGEGGGGRGEGGGGGGGGGIKVFISVAEHDTREFIREAICLNKILKLGQVSVDLYKHSGRDHFDSIDTLLEKDSSLTKRILNMLGLE